MLRPGLKRASSLWYPETKGPLAYSANVLRTLLSLQTHGLAGFHEVESPSHRLGSHERGGLAGSVRKGLVSKGRFNTLLPKSAGSELVCATGECGGVVRQRGFGVDGERSTGVNVSVPELSRCLRCGCEAGGRLLRVELGREG